MSGNRVQQSKGGESKGRKNKGGLGRSLNRSKNVGRARQQAMDAALERMRRFCGAESVTFADDYFRPAG